MTQNIVNVGQTPNDRSADSIRTAFTKINANFTEIYNEIESIEIGEVTWESVTGKPTIPTDISDLTDNQGLLADATDGGSSSSVFDEDLTLNGGSASTIYNESLTINGGGA